MFDSTPIDTAGRYTILDVIRRSSDRHAEILRAYDNELRRPVAIKRQLVAQTASTPSVASLLDEARAIAHIQHPNLIAIYDVTEVSGIASIVMELAEGGSLADRIGTGRPVTVREALDWLVDAAEGLGRAHEAGLVHCDVKPQNLLLSRDGRIKVSGFGLAADLRARPRPDVLHGGTPRFMAPELLSGNVVDPRADQYSWAVVAYLLLGGIHPYDSQRDPATARDIVKGHFVPRPLVVRTPGLPLEIEQVVLRAMRHAPSARFADMRELVGALERARENKPLDIRVVPAIVPTPAPGPATFDPSQNAPLFASFPPPMAGPVAGVRPAAGRSRSRSALFGLGAGAVALALAGMLGSTCLFKRGSKTTTTTTTTTNASPPAAPKARAALCGTDNNVQALALAGDTLFLGGAFESIACPTGSGAIFDLRTGQRKDGVSAPIIAGEVDVAVADPARPAGYYVGGRFDTIGGARVGHLARILPNGEVDSTFAPNVDGQVTSIVVTKDTVYVAGSFSHAGGREHRGTAALEEATGTIRPEFALEQRHVEAIVITGDTLYLAGYFDDVDDQPRSGLAAVDAKTGRLLPWNPKLDGRVAKLALSDSEGTLFVLGSTYSGFTHVNGVKHPGSMAAFDTKTGAVTRFNPEADSVPRTMLVVGDKVYVGGTFDKIDGAARSGVAVLDASTGRVSSFTVPGRWNYVDTLAVRGNTLYLGGSFGEIGDVARRRAAAVDLTTGALTEFDPSLTNTVNTIAVSGDSVFVGGDFAGYGAKPRRHLAALDVRSGQPVDLDIDVDRRVEAMGVAGGDLILAGSFSEVGGHGRGRLAKIDLSTKTVKDWNPNVERGLVEAMVVANDGTIYIGGSFERVGGENRDAIAAIDGATGRPTPFQVKLDGERYSTVSSLALAGQTLYIGGEFTAVNGTPRSRLAAVDAKTGELKSFIADADGTVEALAATERSVFVGGAFSSVGTRPHKYFAALDPAGSPLAPSLDGVIGGRCSALTIAGDILYGGCASGQSELVALDLTTMRYLPVKVEISRRSVSDIVVGSGVAYAAGGFEYVAGLPRPHVVAFDAATGEVY